METIAIVGASLAGTRAAEELRGLGFEGRVVMIGDESDTFYDRPPLSKQVLTGEWDDDDLALLDPTERHDLDLDLRAPLRAVGVDLKERRVLVAGGEPTSYDGLIIATGARARFLTPMPTDPRVHVLRTLQDAHGLAAALQLPDRHLGVIGGGFIGSEVAHAARLRGHRVTILEGGPGPMGMVLGPEVAAELADLQLAAGVDLRTAANVVGLSAEASSEVTVSLDDGCTFTFDHVLVSIGAVPNIEWLEGSGLTLDGGLVCDPRLFAADDVVAAGDVARVRGPDGRLRRRVEHWTDTVRQAQLAASNLLKGRARAEDFGGLPYVWSDQFNVRIEVIGDPVGATSVEGRNLTASTSAGATQQRLARGFRYVRAGETAAFVTVGSPQTALAVRRLAGDPGQLAPLTWDAVFASMTPAPPVQRKDRTDED